MMVTLALLKILKALPQSQQKSFVKNLQVHLTNKEKTVSYAMANRLLTPFDLLNRGLENLFNLVYLLPF